MEGTCTTGLTLGALLDDDALGLELVVGGDEARARIVEGAHSIEVPHPARWLDDGWVMLTTGIALTDDPDQRELVRELDESGATALGFGIGVSHDDVPEALVEEARRRNFPLFVIPLAIPFRNVVAAVQLRTVGTEAQAFGRLTAMQRYLTAALSEPDPESSIVSRLAELVDADVAVVDAKGTVRCGHLPLEQTTLREATAATGRHARRVDDHGFIGWTLPIDAHGPSAEQRPRPDARWLVAGAAPPRRDHPLLKPAAQLAVQLLEATARLAESRAQQDRALRRATLDVLLDASGEQDTALAAARAQACGVDVTQGARAVVVATRTVAALDPAALLDMTEDRVAAQGWSWLSTRRDDTVVVLVPAEVADEDVLGVLLEVHPHALVGIGRTVHRADGVGASQLDAALVVRQLSRRGPERAASYDDLDLGSALIGEIDPDRIRVKVDRWLTPVLENAMAYETLVSYLEHDLDVGRTSRALKLHPNSARYRLARVEELLGAPLRRPSTIAALHFALLSQRYTAAPRTETGAEMAHAA